MMKISKTVVIKILLSCCFFWILVSFVQTNQLVEVFTQINWFFFIVSFLLVPVMLAISCFKWKMVLDLDKKKIPFFQLIKIYLIGYFFSNLLPSTVGGDVVRSYYTGNIINNQSFSAIAIIVERFSGVIILLMLVILLPFFHFSLYKLPYFYIPAIVSSVLLFIIVLMARKKKSFEFLERIHHILNLFINKIVSLIKFTDLQPFAEKIDQFILTIIKKLTKLGSELSSALHTIRSDRRLLLKIVLSTLVFYLFTMLNVYVSFRAFNVNPEFFIICIVVPTALFVAQFPVTLLGNIGFFESVFVFYFLFIGIPGAETLAMGLLLRIKMFAIGGVGYFVYLSYRSKYKIDQPFKQ